MNRANKGGGGGSLNADREGVNLADVICERSLTLIVHFQKNSPAAGYYYIFIK